MANYPSASEVSILLSRKASHPSKKTNLPFKEGNSPSSHLTKKTNHPSKMTSHFSMEIILSRKLLEMTWTLRTLVDRKGMTRMSQRWVPVLWYQKNWGNG